MKKTKHLGSEAYRRPSSSAITLRQYSFLISKKFSRNGSSELLGTEGRRQGGKETRTDEVDEGEGVPSHSRLAVEGLVSRAGLS